jgi:Aldehyde dehydrogenase family
MPFGGYKQSGYGREHGLEVMEHCTQTKAVWVDLQDEPAAGAVGDIGGDAGSAA